MTQVERMAKKTISDLGGINSETVLKDNFEVRKSARKDLGRK